MNELKYFGLDLSVNGDPAEVLRSLLSTLSPPCGTGDVGIKVHWGERGNRSFLSPVYVREIVRWLQKAGGRPFVFDTTVLYSGGRREGADTLKTAEECDRHSVRAKTFSARPGGISG